jgi:hypothetical protein
MLKVPKTVSTPYKCGQIYIKQTGNAIKTSFKEHLIIWLSQPWFSTPSACSSQSNSEHQGIYKYGVVTEIKSLPKKIKREVGLLISRLWKTH